MTSGWLIYRLTPERRIIKWLFKWTKFLNNIDIDYWFVNSYLFSLVYYLMFPHNIFCYLTVVFILAIKLQHFIILKLKLNDCIKSILLLILVLSCQQSLTVSVFTKVELLVLSMYACMQLNWNYLDYSTKHIGLKTLSVHEGLVTMVSRRLPAFL
jgi:hypothetical protein